MHISKKKLLDSIKNYNQMNRFNPLNRLTLENQDVLHPLDLFYKGNSEYIYIGCIWHRHQNQPTIWYQEKIRNLTNKNPIASQFITYGSFYAPIEETFNSSENIIQKAEQNDDNDEIWPSLALTLAAKQFTLIENTLTHDARALADVIDQLNQIDDAAQNLESLTNLFSQHTLDFTESYPGYFGKRKHALMHPALIISLSAAMKKNATLKDKVYDHYFNFENLNAQGKALFDLFPGYIDFVTGLTQLHGLNGEPNLTLAFKKFEDASKKGHNFMNLKGASHYALAICYLKQIGTKQDLAKGSECLYQAYLIASEAKTFDPLTLYWITEYSNALLENKTISDEKKANLYLIKGRELSKDDKQKLQALAAYSKAHGLGCKAAFTFLAEAYLNGYENGQTNREKAKQIYLDAISRAKNKHELEQILPRIEHFDLEEISGECIKKKIELGSYGLHDIFFNPKKNSVFESQNAILAYVDYINNSKNLSYMEIINTLSRLKKILTDKNYQFISKELIPIASLRCKNKKDIEDFLEKTAIALKLDRKLILKNLDYKIIFQLALCNGINNNKLKSYVEQYTISFFIGNPIIEVVTELRPSTLPKLADYLIEMPVKMLSVSLIDIAEEFLKSNKQYDVEQADLDSFAFTVLNGHLERLNKNSNSHQNDILRCIDILQKNTFEFSDKSKTQYELIAKTILNLITDASFINSIRIEAANQIVLQFIKNEIKLNYDTYVNALNQYINKARIVFLNSKSEVLLDNNHYELLRSIDNINSDLESFKLNCENKTILTHINSQLSAFRKFYNQLYFRSLYHHNAKNNDQIKDNPPDKSASAEQLFYYYQRIIRKRLDAKNRLINTITRVTSEENFKAAVEGIVELAENGHFLACTYLSDPEQLEAISEKYTSRVKTINPTQFKSSGDYVKRAVTAFKEEPVKFDYMHLNDLINKNRDMNHLSYDDASSLSKQVKEIKNNIFNLDAVPYANDKCKKTESDGVETSHESGDLGNSANKTSNHPENTPIKATAENSNYPELLKFAKVRVSTGSNDKNESKNEKIYPAINDKTTRLIEEIIPTPIPNELKSIPLYPMTFSQNENTNGSTGGPVEDYQNYYLVMPTAPFEYHDCNERIVDNCDVQLPEDFYLPPSPQTHHNDEGPEAFEQQHDANEINALTPPVLSSCYNSVNSMEPSPPPYSPEYSQTESTSDKSKLSEIEQLKLQLKEQAEEMARLNSELNAQKEANKILKVKYTEAQTTIQGLCEGKFDAAIILQTAIRGYLAQKNMYANYAEQVQKEMKAKIDQGDFTLIAEAAEQMKKGEPQWAYRIFNPLNGEATKKLDWTEEPDSTEYKKNKYKLD